jgi:hypothetical protein
MDSGGKAPVSDQLQPLVALPKGYSLLYSLNMRWGGPQLYSL